MKFLIYSLLILLFFSACSQSKKTKKKQIKHIKKEGFYELQVVSDGQFLAFLSTKETGSIKKEKLLKFNPNDTIGWLWRLKIKTENNWSIDSSFHVTSIYDFKGKLNGIFSKMPYQAPKNCNYQYKNNKFEPVEEIIGNQIDTTKLNKQILSKINAKQTQLSINFDDSYRKPKYYMKDRAAAEGLEKLKKCLKAEITITLTDSEVKITKDDFAEWLTLDSNMKVDIINAKGAKFIQAIASKHDVIEKSITFTTNSGTLKTVPSELGIRIDVYRELSRLEKDIISGEKVEREPIYGMKGIPSGAFDSNKNYVEVSISDQKMWLYRNGQLVTESSVVTGCPCRGHATPHGAYYVKYKGRNVVLDGPGYSSRVSWWMPFNKGVGLHDASWRRRFGGEIYLADGSHGCVNLPPATAKFIYDYIQAGSIVICY